MKLKITKGTVIRTVMIAIVIINMILKKLGVSVINADQSTVASIVEAVIEIGAIVAAWWYNNSFSDAAKKADSFFKALKDVGYKQNKE